MQCELKEDEDPLSSSADQDGTDATARALKDTKMLEVIFRTVCADTLLHARCPASPCTVVGRKPAHCMHDDIDTHARAD